MSRRSLWGRTYLVVPVAMSVVGAAALGVLPAGSSAQGSGSVARSAGVPGGLTPIGRGAAPGAKGRLVEKYTTANSDTYELPSGRMLTHVYAVPVNTRDASGKWQPLSGAEPSPSTAATSGATLSPNAERNPLGQENEAACTLTSTAPTTSACNELTFKAGYESSSKSTRRGLVQFVLPELHEELIVLNAQLELYVGSTTTTAGAAMGAYRVTTPWTTKATWNTSNGSAPWTTPGGDYANPEKESDAAVNPSVGATKGWTYWYPTRMVQEWYNGANVPSGQGQPDLGFLLKDVTEGATNNVVSFDGREERERNPGLTLEWVQRGVGGATNYTIVPMQLSSTLSLDINPASGNLMIHSNDMKVPSKGLEFVSARNWNSLENEAPGYGYGWVDTNAVYVHVTPGGSVAYTDATGNSFPFIKEGANFRTPRGIEATMCAAGSAAPCPATLPKGATYQLIYTKTGERINFGQKEYEFLYPISVEDSAGEAQTAHYTSGLELPTSWIDTEGTKLAYTESEAAGYTKITDEGNGHSVSYNEELGEDGLYHLVKYTNENKEQTNYTIGSGLEGNLIKEVIEPSGNVVKLYYESNYRIAKIVPTTNGPATTFTYYGFGAGPGPCTSSQQATVITSPEGKLKIYCSNALDEVEQTKEIEPDKTPPVFGEFEVSAYLSPESKITTLYFEGAEDPPLPNGEPGSGVAKYTYRYRINNGTFTAWQQTAENELQISGVSAGATILIEAYATDNAGNVSKTVSGSAVVPPAGEGNPIGEEDTEKETTEPSLPVAEGIVMNDSEEDSELEGGSGGSLTGLQPAFTRERYEIISRGTVRGNANALVVGTAVPKMTFDVKTTSGSWYYGRLYKYVGVCAWVQHEHAKETSSKIVNTCPASRGIPTKSYASLINCDSCNATSSIPFEPVRNAQGEAVNTKIPVFANVRPYTKESPHEEFATMNTVVGGKVQSVGWRYITKSGKYVLVSASVEYPNKSKHTEWAFIESKYLPSTQVLCRGYAPKRPAKHTSWPNVCREGF